MKTIKIDIVSAEGEIHSGDANMVYVPAKWAKWALLLDTPLC